MSAPADQLSEAELAQIAKAVRDQIAEPAEPIKPWAQQRGSEAWLAAAVPVLAAGIPLVNDLLGGREITPLEFTALVLGVAAVLVAYIVGRSLIKAEAIRAEKGQKA